MSGISPMTEKKLITHLFLLFSSTKITSAVYSIVKMNRSLPGKQVCATLVHNALAATCRRYAFSQTGQRTSVSSTREAASNINKNEIYWWPFLSATDISLLSFLNKSYASCIYGESKCCTWIRTVCMVELRSLMRSTTFVVGSVARRPAKLKEK